MSSFVYQLYRSVFVMTSCVCTSIPSISSFVLLSCAVVYRFSSLYVQVHSVSFSYLSVLSMSSLVFSTGFFPPPGSYIYIYIYIYIYDNTNFSLTSNWLVVDKLYNVFLKLRYFTALFYTISLYINISLFVYYLFTNIHTMSMVQKFSECVFHKRGKCDMF